MTNPENVPVPLDEVSFAQTTTTFDLEYELTGPPVTAPYSSAHCCPELARIRVVCDLDGVHVQRVTVRGARAKKDGSPGLNPMTADFWPSSITRDVLPDYLAELAAVAERQVRKWLSA